MVGCCSNAHSGETCAAYNARIGGDPDYVASLRAIRGASKPCPHCGMDIQLQGGCDHVRCPSCHLDWCWRCGGKQVRRCLKMRARRRAICTLVFRPLILYVLYACLYVCPLDLLQMTGTMMRSCANCKQMYLDHRYVIQPGILVCIGRAVRDV